MKRHPSTPRLRAMLLTGGLATAIAIAGIADAGQRDVKIAERAADRATRALAAHDAAGAIALAEQAVSISPRDPGYRLILGQSYLAAGRFASARAALGDAMTLAPANGRIALNLALATIATGDAAAARQMLASHRGMIQSTDLGLATALAGDPASAVAILIAAVRKPDATVKTRQNLALSLALAGQWEMARIAAATDLSPADLDRRMQQWALFAQLRDPGDQVATLLGVTPVADPGQPVALALAAPVAVASAAVVPVAPVPVPVVAAKPAPAAAHTPARSVSAAPVAAIAHPIASTVAAAPAAATAVRVIFGPPSPVVQPLPVATIRPAAGKARVAAWHAKATHRPHVRVAAAHFRKVRVASTRPAQGRPGATPLPSPTRDRAALSLAHGAKPQRG